jgi:ribosome-associated translation inhibitor RaiA
MQFSVRAHAITLDQPTRDYAEAKIGGAVRQVLSHTASHVDVEITNLDGGSGAPCSRVKVHVTSAHHGPITVQAEDETVRPTIDVAADRIWRAVKRQHQRRRDLARHGGDRLPA